MLNWLITFNETRIDINIQERPLQFNDLAQFLISLLFYICEHFMKTIIDARS